MVMIKNLLQRIAFERLFEASPYKDKYEALFEFDQKDVDELADTIDWDEIK